jgi:hypothetical protein
MALTGDYNIDWLPPPRIEAVALLQLINEAGRKVTLSSSFFSF